MSGDEREPSEYGDIICPGCMQPVEGEPVFCPHCNAPLGGTVGYDPLKEVFAYRFLFQRGVERPTNRLILLGIIAVLGINFGLSGIYTSFAFGEPGWNEQLPGLVVSVIVSSIGVLAALKCIRNYFRIRSESGPPEHDPD